MSLSRPLVDVSLLADDSQDFSITASDVDGNVLDTLSETMNDSEYVLLVQWFLDNLALAGQNSTSFSFIADETGEFEVKVLVTDNKDYSTHKWMLTVSNKTSGSFSVTGAATGVVEQDGFSLWSWIKKLL